MAKKLALDPSELLKNLHDEEQRLYAEFELKMKEKREKALSDIIEPLKAERSELCQQINEANTRISEIDKELGKLTGSKEKTEKKASGKRTRRTAEEMEVEKKELAAMGSKLFGVLKKKGNGEQIPVGELSAISMGIAVKKALQGHIDAGLVQFHANGPKPLYSFIKDGDVKAE